MTHIKTSRAKHPDRMLDLATLAYVAGFFDGEGCVGVYQQRCGQYACLRTQVSQVRQAAHDSLVDTLIDVYGGRAGLQVTSSGKTQRNWYAAGDQAARFLADILPHLRLKREQAQFAIRWQRRRHGHRRDGNGRIVPKPESEARFDAAVAELMKALKNDPLAEVLERRADLAPIAQLLIDGT